jgi:hypothetical protein
MKINQRSASGASASGAVNSRLLTGFAAELDNLMLDISAAACAAELAHRHAQYSKITCDVSEENNIYFPPSERRILDFVMNDVATRLLALDKIASALSDNLMGILKELREAEEGNGK